MASMKRKASDMDDSDEEEPAFGKQILPVANLPDSFDGEPMDGLQYLFTVRREFYRLPHVTRVPNPYETPALPQKPVQNDDDIKVSRLPSQEWRTTFERRFINFRKNIAQPSATVGVGSITQGGRKTLPEKKDRDRWWAFLQGKPEIDWNPPKRPKVDKGRRQRNRDNLDGGLLGPWTPVNASQTESKDTSSLVNIESSPMKVPSFTPSTQSIAVNGDASTSAKTSSDITREVSEAANATKSEPAQPMPLEPTPELLRDIDHRYATHLLMYFSHWISLHLEYLDKNKTSPKPTPNTAADSDSMSIGSSRSSSPAPLLVSASAPITAIKPEKQSPHPINAVHLRWLFALLAKVEEQTSADEMAQLRSLARGCIELIKHDIPSLAGPCWMVVAAVAGVWAQRDLWMDAEDILS